MMEGDRGMVAVVEGLRDAGLAVTLLSRRFRPAPDRAAVTGRSTSTPADRACQTAVDSATETTYKNAADNPLYRSSYQASYGNQLAHYRPDTFMPAYLDQYAVQGLMQCRGSISRSVEKEAFVESLRKYPTTPIRSRSADLIERMLKHTQNKNGSRYSNTRSAKSLPSKEALKKLHYDEIPTKDTTSAKNDVRPNFGYKRDAELIPVPTSIKKSRRDDQYGMFDYLKSHHKDKTLKGTEVRYLTNVKQSIRDKLLQLCDEDSAPKMICPKIQSRYTEHKKRCHNNASPKVIYCKKIDKCTTCKQSMREGEYLSEQHSGCRVLEYSPSFVMKPFALTIFFLFSDTLQNEVQNSPSTSKQHKESFVEKCLTTLKHSKVCFCERQEPCDCKCEMSMSTVKPTSQTTKHKQCLSICEHDCNRDDDCHALKLKENVFDWLQELPVRANFTATDALKIQEITDQLINNLNKIGNDSSNLNKIEYEIKKCLKMLPMWRSDNKSEQESIENELAQKLLKRIKKILSEKNNLEDPISMRMGGVPFTSETVDKQEFINGSIDKLKPITLNRGLSDKDYKETLKSEMPNELPIEGSPSADVNNIADKLVEKLMSLLRGQLVSGKRNLPMEHLNNIVQKWFDDIPNTLPVEDYEEDIEMLAKTLHIHLQSIENNEYLENCVRREIINWLQNLQKKQGKDIDSGSQENLVNNHLIANIKKEPKVRDSAVGQELIVKKNWEGLEAQPEFKDNTSQLKLQDTKDTKGYVTDDDVKAELTNRFEKLSQKRGTKIDSDNQGMLLNSVGPTKRRRYWEKPKSIREMVTKEISDTLNDTIIPLKESVKERLKEQVAEVITKEWNTMQSIQTDELLSKIIHIIKSATNLPEAQIISLAQTLTNKVKEDILPKLPETIELDKPSKNKLKEKLESILGILLLNNKEKVIDAITDTLMKNHEDDTNGNVFEEILEQLKKANVDNNNAQKLTSDVLEMWHQFKDEFKDTTFSSPSYESTESLRMHKQMFIQRLERELTDFMERVLNESSSSYKDKTSEDSLNQYNKFKIPPFTTSTPIKSDRRANNIEKAYKNQIKEMIKKWIATLEINGLVDETFKDDMATDIATDIIDRQRYLQLSKKKPPSQDELEHLKYQVFKWTSKLPNQTNLTTKTSKLKMLIKSIEALGTPNLTQDRNEQQFTSNLHNPVENLEKNMNGALNANILSKKDAIKRAVQNWCQTLPLKRGKMYSDIKDIVNDLTEAMSRYFLNTDIENVNTYMDEILSNLKKLPLQFDKDDSKNLPEYTERLIETLKEVINDSESYRADDLSVKKPALKKAADSMFDNIQNWCENLPLELYFANEGSEQIKVIKQNLAANLLKKVGELNLDPEIFHDDNLYEEILKDEIDQVIESLPKNKQLEELLPTLKGNLAKDLLAAKDEMKNELAGFAYKQQLRDAISKTLSSIGELTKEIDQTPFEILKDNLADKFISLHYVANADELKKKFKEKIFNEINKFCNDYVKQNPSSPLNVHQLNQELYNALKRIPVPKEESMRREVEQIRIKDLVNDWLQKLPLEDTPSHTQKNKIISILAKRLYEIENDTALNSAKEKDERMNNEIVKWLKKLKLKFVNGMGEDAIVKTLINKLKATEHSRKSIYYTDSTSGFDETPRYPPSMLSTSDRAHLSRIKARTPVERNGRKDASVSPAPIATGTQTEQKQYPDTLIPQKNSQNAGIQTTNPEPATQITPQVIVKEYYWDSNGSSTLQGSGSILSYVQSPAAHVADSIQQQTKVTPHETSHVTSASQTISLPESKSTLTQNEFTELTSKQTGKQNNGREGTLTQDSLTTTAMKAKEVPQESHYKPDDYLQLNLGKKGAQPCQPCRERAVLCGDLGISESEEAGPSKAYKQARTCPLGEGNNEETCYKRNRCAALPRVNVADNNNYFDDEGNTNELCFRRPICHSPFTHPECLLKCKRKSQQHCTCKSPTLPKCTIRPHSDKSCYVAKKHCPKCWDGFCPHPSFLYFRPD